MNGAVANIAASGTVKTAAVLKSRRLCSAKGLSLRASRRIPATAANDSWNPAENYCHGLSESTAQNASMRVLSGFTLRCIILAMAKTVSITAALVTDADMPTSRA